MAIKALGKITVAHHGTPVPLASSQLMCSAVIITPLSANTKGVAIGDSSMVLATRAHCFTDLLDPGQAIELPPHFGLGNHIDAAAIYIDTEVDNEGVVVYVVY